MKSIIALIVAAGFSLPYGAIAQNAGPSPQSGMDKPGITDGAKSNGAMDTTGMSTAKGNMKRKTDGAPAAGAPDRDKRDIRR